MGLMTPFFSSKFPKKLELFFSLCQFPCSVRYLVTGKYFQCNSSFIKTFGYELSELIERSPANHPLFKTKDFFQKLDRDFRDEIGKLDSLTNLNNKKLPLQLNTSTEASLLLVTKNNVLIEAWIQCSLIEEDSQYYILETFHRMRVVTQSQLFESADTEALRHFFELIPLPAIVFEASSLLIRNVNQTLLDHSGLNLNQIVGLSLEKFFLNPWKLVNLQSRITKKDFPYTDETALLWPDDQIRDLLLTYDLVRLNHIECIVCIMLDITERKKLERQRIETNQEDISKTIATGIAHDFNNLLMILVGNISLVLRDQIPDRSRKYLDQIQTVSNQARQLTTQLYNFSKNKTTTKELIFLPQIIQATLEFVCRGTNIIHEVEISQDLWLIQANQGQIEQVLQNLFVNAQQAMNQSGIIKVRADNIIIHPQSQIDLLAGMYVKLTVEDSGPGIDSDVLDKIFDPYFTTKGNTHGLGLAVVKSIITEHKGLIEITTKKNEGTQISCFFPAYKHSEQISSPYSLEQVISTTTLFRGKVLLLEAQREVQVTISNMLQEIGFQVDCVASGAQAILKYREAVKTKDIYAVFFFDVTSQKGLSPKEVLRVIQELHSQSNIILCSSTPLEISEDEMKTIGISGVLVKPFNIKTLKRVIKQVLKIIK